MIKKIIKSLLLLLVVLIIISGGLILAGLNYSTYDLKADRSLFPHIQTEQDVDALAERLVSEMTLNEKLQQMWGEKPFWGYLKLATSFLIRDRFPHIYVGRNERLNIPPWVLSDGPRGAVVGAGNTVFPVAMARGASWDVDLERRVADVIGKEVRANGANYNAAPCINLLRHPAWGRAQETYGEDPWLLGEFAVAYIRSVQQHNVMACPKHFALNSIENSRFYVDVDLDERTLHEVYLPHFKKAVVKGKPASIMSAYNQFRGDFASHSRYLLTDILRDEWGFQGFVTSDWIHALRDGVKGVKAGMDIEMPIRNHYGKPLKTAIEAGEVSEDEIDVIVERILKTRLQYAFAEDNMEYNQELKAHEEHLALAREVAEKSMVLLKNEEVLPFAEPAGRSVAVMGSLANLKNTGDRGSSHVRNDNIITPWEGIRQFTESRNGTAELYDGDNTETALSIAGHADQVVLIVGYTYEDEGEYFVMSTDPVENPGEQVKRSHGGDRSRLTLSEKDEKLIQQVTAVNPNTVVVIVAGSAVIMENWRDDAPAILYGWYAGMEGGHALARILFGEVSPGGKLPFTIPADETHLPPFDPWAQTIHYGYYHGYTLFDKEGIEPAFPFGYGLSYTDFEYREAATAQDLYSPTDTLSFSVTLSNSGERVGEEVVQLYIGFMNSGIDRPVKLLRGFYKIHLDPGEEKSVKFTLPAEELAWYNSETATWEIEEMEYEFYIGSSSREDDLLSGMFEIVLDR